MAKWAFRQIDPQPARGTLQESMWDDPNWIAEEKMDGDRRIAQFCGKIVRFTGRRKSVKDGLYVEKTENVPHLAGLHVEEFPLGVNTLPPKALDGTVLDGEMIVACTPVHNCEVQKGGASKYVTSIMGSLPEEAVRKQIERGWLRYVVFDCLFYKGRDVRDEYLRVRRGYAESALGAWRNPFVSAAKEVGLSGKTRFRDEILARGGEGVILKRLDHKYGDKQGWVKVKGEWTADVVIMGFVPAKEMSKKADGAISMTKYAKAGLIGAIRCGQYQPHPKGVQCRCIEGVHLKEVATVSGMDDELRADITKNPKKYLGRVLRIKQNGREPTGRFRHPRWDELRDDKSAKDCVYREGEI